MEALALTTVPATNASVVSASRVNDAVKVSVVSVAHHATSVVNIVAFARKHGSSSYLKTGLMQDFYMYDTYECKCMFPCLIITMI